ncbi:DUF222 domain-containing protein [Micromonospora sp. DT233]|uniref:HNH endonuclease signature motif containing protein n=1 Tax=Micromonospora sp. DT233 TaxID=3393432 RepID=UPI003CF3C2A0
MIDELTRADLAVRPCVDAPAWAMPDPALIEALDAVHVLEQRLAAVKLALVREIDGRGVAAAHGASSTAAWLRERLRLSIGGARRLVADALTLDATTPALRAALAAGTITLEQGRVIAEAVAAIPEAAGAAAPDRATRLLIESAAQFEPAILRRLGARILTHVAPELAETAEAAALAAEDARGERHRQLTLTHLPDGRIRLTGSLDAEAGALLNAAIEPLSRPQGLDDVRSAGQRRADALADVCRLALRSDQLPEHGADTAQIVVTTDYDVLRGQLGLGTLDTGLRLPPATVRRLACDAAILPAVLDGAGQVLDLGRRRRLVNGPLRRALVLRDRGCAFPGCDRPPRWCDAHHIRHWADGGRTNLDNAVLLCRHHHRQVHHHGWQVRLAADGLPEFLPPAWLDPGRNPRRNQYHRRT